MTFEHVIETLVWMALFLIPPAVVVALVVVRKRKRAIQEGFTPRHTETEVGWRFLLAVIVNIAGWSAITLASDLDFISGWAIAHGSFVIVWPLAFGGIYSLHSLLCAR